MIGVVSHVIDVYCPHDKLTFLIKKKKPPTSTSTVVRVQQKETDRKIESMSFQSSPVSFFVLKTHYWGVLSESDVL